MLKSVYENGGFWIGRYEAGIGKARKEKDSSRKGDKSTNGLIPLSKIDQYPINWVTCSEAQTIAENVPSKGIYNSSLMFGIQWDLILKYLSNKGVSTTDLTSNSENWGNYNLDYYLNQSTAHGFKGYTHLNVLDSIPDLSWSSIKEGYFHKVTDDKVIVLSTGATTRNMKMNIYDLAGNMNEWTLERSTDSNVYPLDPCVIRGGCFIDSDTSVSWREDNGTDYSIYDIGFRVSIY